MTPRLPTDESWRGRHLIEDLLKEWERVAAEHRYGPFTVRHGPKWDQYLDDDYRPVDPLPRVAGYGELDAVLNAVIERVNCCNHSNKTLRDRLKDISFVEDVLIDRKGTEFNLTLEDAE